MTGRVPPRVRAVNGYPVDQRPTLVTGGAGFIGTNLAHRLASGGGRVIIYDNLSRPGVRQNLAWLRASHGELIEVEIADVRDAARLKSAVERAGQVFHLAAQVAVTASLVDPLDDFLVNASGTLTLLEALRHSPVPRPLVFTSTNKVYGAIEDLPLDQGIMRYAPQKRGRGHRGIDEHRSLDFRSPYGCSKGAAEQYVLDYARSYGLPAVVFRMSCIYGPHQCGTEDQGWVAHFLLSAISGKPITIYGDGRQVRDILHVDDLVDAFLLAQRSMNALRGEAFNIGGGPENTTSLLELISQIARLHGRAPDIITGAWRTGDQRYYVSNHGKFSAATGWRPKIGAKEGVARLYRWLSERRVPSSREAVELPARTAAAVGVPA